MKYYKYNLLLNKSLMYSYIKNTYPTSQKTFQRITNFKIKVKKIKYSKSTDKIDANTL